MYIKPNLLQKGYLMVKLSFITQEHSYQIREGTELLQACKIDPSIPIRFGCCQGNCGTCLIKVVEGHDSLSKQTKQEKETLQRKQKDTNYRLACQCAILGDVVLET